MRCSICSALSPVMLVWCLLAPVRVVAQAPQNLTATADRETVELSWDAPDVDAGDVVVCYRVYRDTVEIPDSDPEDQTDQRLAETDPPPGNPTYTDESVTRGVTYYYRVTADVAERGVTVSCGGPLTEETDFSNQVSATPAAPVTIEITRPEVPVSGPVDAGSSVEVRATVTNAPASGVDLRYRRGGAPSFTSVAMQGDDDAFVATVPGEAVTIRGVEFVVAATDPQGTTVRAPAEGIASVRVRVDRLSFTQNGGTAQSAYRMVSFPTVLDDARLEALFEDTLGPPDDTQWRLFGIGDPALAASGDYVEQTNMSAQFPSGRALWLITRSDATLDSGRGTSVRTDQPFRTSVQAGWNLVGNPFAFDVPLTRLRVEDTNGGLDEVFGYEGTFVPLTGGDVVEPFRGYLVRLSGGSDGTLVVNPTGDDDGGSAVTKRSPETSWHLDVAARVDRARDTYNRLGVAPGATDGADAWDRREAPPIGDYVSLAFHPPGSAGRSFWRDLRAETRGVKTWDASVRTNVSGTVTLDVTGVQTVPEDWTMWLVDPALDVARDLRQTPRYLFSASGTEVPRRIQFVAGPPEAVRRILGRSVAAPREVELQSSAPHPVHTHATLRYGVPDATRVTLELFDLLGRRVATLIDDRPVSAGYHTLSWDASAGGRTLSSGTYVMRLRAGDVTRSRRLVVVR